MIRFSERVSICEVDDELVLLDSASGKYFSINAVGRRVFELLGQDPRIESAVSALLAEFDVEEKTLRADIHLFLVEMKAKGLVETDEV